MIDERTETQASLYALGALPPDEAREFEAALRADPRLRALVGELRAAADGMTAAFPRVAPPAALKAKVMSAIADRPAAPVVVAPVDADAPDTTRTPNWISFMPWALAACFAVLCVVLISVGKNLRQQALALSDQLHESNAEVGELHSRLDQLRAELGVRTSNDAQRIVTIQTQAVLRINELSRQTAALTNQLVREQEALKRRFASTEDEAKRLALANRALTEALAGVTLPNNERYRNVRLAVMHPTPDGSPGTTGASVWIPQDQRGLIVLEKLPQVPNPSLQDYQLWLIDPNSPAPVSAGTFLPDAAGSVNFSFNAAANVRAVDKFAVSVEPKRGVPRPTGKIVLLSN